MNRHSHSFGRGVERRAALLLFTIGALLFVGIQSRVAQSLPSSSSQQLLTSFSDPVKFPPPEERDSEVVCLVAIPVAVVAPPRPRIVDSVPVVVPDVGDGHAAVHLLRGPPASL